MAVACPFPYKKEKVWYYVTCIGRLHAVPSLATVVKFVANSFF